MAAFSGCCCSTVLDKGYLWSPGGACWLALVRKVNTGPWPAKALPGLSTPDYPNAHPPMVPCLVKATVKGKYLSSQHLLSGTKSSPRCHRMSHFKTTFVQGLKELSNSAVRQSYQRGPWAVGVGISGELCFSGCHGDYQSFYGACQEGVG